MKKKFFAIISLISLVGSFSLCAQNNLMVKRMKFVHRDNTGQDAPQKARSNSGEVIRMEAMDVDSSMNKAAVLAGRIEIIPHFNDYAPHATYLSAWMKAVDIWSSYLTNSNPIRIVVKMEPMPNDINAECYVNYIQTGADECTPTSLWWANSSSIRTTSNTEEYDAEVIFNSNKVWDTTTSLENRSDGGLNMTTTLMRCIAQTMGFGTTIMYDAGGVNMDHSKKFGRLYGDNVLSKYEKLIYDPTGIKLANLDINSEDFSNFVQPESGSGKYIIYAKNKYLLYTPDHFEETKSLAYLNNPSSLMWYDFQPEDKFFRVDDTTIDILKQTGWTKLSDRNTVPSLKITLNKVNAKPFETFRANAYDRLRLEINDSILGNTSNCRHALYVFNKNTGKRIPVDGESGSEPKGGKTRIFQVQNPFEYYINDMGEVKVELQYDCSVNGSPIETQVYRLGLDAKPFIRSISNTQVDRIGNGKVNARCNVNFDGHIIENIDGQLKERHNSYFVHVKKPGESRFRYQSVDKDSLGRIIITNLDQAEQSSTTVIRIFVKNDLGVSIPFTWNFSPTSPDFNPGNGYPTEFYIHYYNSIYDMDGNKITECNDDNLDETLGKLKSGYYVVRKEGSDGSVKNKTIKIE